MNRSRLDAFSDGVFAIIITIMVLELRAPEGTSWAVIKPLIPIFLCYVLSFVYILIYWGNHHHLMHTSKSVSAAIIWANAHLLFWLSLVPFATAWMGVNNFERITVAAYGAVLLLCGLAYSVLARVIRKTYKEESDLSRALTRDNTKGTWSTVLYTAAIPLALFVHPLISAAIYVIVAILWIVPSKDIERALEKLEQDTHVK
jgi:uncharacterized membrane protein